MVFYYGGHGFNFGGDLIIPIDAKEKNDQFELNESVSPTWIRNMIQKNAPSLLFMILDMCRTHSTPMYGCISYHIQKFYVYIHY